MSTAATGLVHGKTITLDEELPPLEGKRVRVVVELFDESEEEILTAAQNAAYWDQWVKDGPHGPIEDDAPDFE